MRLRVHVVQKERAVHQVSERPTAPVDEQRGGGEQCHCQDEQLQGDGEEEMVAKPAEPLVDHAAAESATKFCTEHEQYTAVGANAGEAAKKICAR